VARTGHGVFVYSNEFIAASASMDGVDDVDNGRTYGEGDIHYELSLFN
jgi:hypothetical protein